MVGNSLAIVICIMVSFIKTAAINALFSFSFLGDTFHFFLFN